jgi:hypothetical protein
MTPALFGIFLVCGLIIGCLGRHKKLGFWGFFFASMLLTPLVGLLLLIVAGPGKPCVHCGQPRT